MHNLLTSATLLACISYAVAKPVPHNRAFTVKQVHAGKVYKSGAMQTLKTYRKFGAKPPASVVKAADAQQSGSVSASPEQYDSSYLCPVTVGGTTLTLDFDSGSSDLWVFSSLTPSSERSGHSYYTPSNGSAESGETWNIGYQDGSGASGVVYADTVVVGGVTATSQAVEAATSVSSTFSADTDNDGLLGLAFGSINTCSPNKCSTFFDTVEPTLASPVFTADLKKGQPGSYTFGFIDNSAYTGSITYVSVDNSQGFWGFTAGGYSVGGGSTSGSIGSSIADTGTSLFYLPDDVVSAYWGQVNGASNSQSDGGYIFPCSASLPDFNVEIGGSTFTVPGSYLNYSPVSSGSSSCFGGIQSNSGIGMSIFGDVFLKAVYVVFEPNTPQIGFASQ